MFEIYETKERVMADKEAEAAKLRKLLRDNGTFMVNLMGSPGSGKTSVLIRTINALKEKYRIAVMEADVESDVDARTINDLGVRVIQLHSGGLCHMDADMTARGVIKLGIEDTDLLILENIGNLVCPAEFDTGANLKVMILSVPEGDDKPLKYPLMFTVSDCMLINKIDTLPVFDFNMEKCLERARRLNENIVSFAISAETGEGMDEWIEWLSSQIEQWRNSL
ncbi:MAG: hydrogenase nickel incorporation protein HypB [Erysipelotrichaceae bacterium]|nr:hydrogenase nickel incorporation protein HypB [Erysipelotrichaceae bacterium]